MRSLFLLAYACSGFAGLVYEVGWTRLLTLAIGHSTAAASAVIAAFLGGLALGAALGGRYAAAISRARSLQVYAALEAGVAVLALLLPWGLAALTPALAAVYDNGAPSLAFPIVRTAVCFALVLVPAVALGATFPMAVRWDAADDAAPARRTSVLYAVNTAGAALGASLAGLYFIPRLGLSATVWVGVAASATATAIALVLLRVAARSPARTRSRPAPPTQKSRRGPARSPVTAPSELPAPVWLPAVVLGITGCAGLMHEIAWTRILTLVLGPTIYAFAATLAVVIAGIAIGSAIGTSMAARSRRPAALLTWTLAVATVTVSVTTTLAGHDVPRWVAEALAASDGDFDAFFTRGVLLTIGLVLPTALCLGAAFPLGLAMIAPRRMAEESAPDSARMVAAFGAAYAVNTVGAVTGSLAAGFLIIPAIGLRSTLFLVSAALLGALLLLVIRGPLLRRDRLLAPWTMAAAAAIALSSPSWDRELLASGLYLYTPFVPKDLDLVAQLKAGTLLYYEEGAASTVSVKRLTGTTTLAVDGKVDASNRGDMLTQKLAAHLPLLLHPQPRDVAIIGLGSGVTVGSALRHPIARADVLEISPQVVTASTFFRSENHDALADPRTNLIVGDGRSHLLLTNRQYDVIISEPSNPWIAGVAALFTREFFLAARSRLAPGGIICQWANAYNISEPDLRSIVRTFQSVFPEGTAWLVGADDVLLVASSGPLDGALADIGRHWQRPAVADDLAIVGATEPFAVWSMFVAGPAELRRFAADALIFDDDHMTLEFSGPRQLHVRAAGENAAALSDLFNVDTAPAAIRTALRDGGAGEWRRRAAMLARRDAHTLAYEDYVRALRLDPLDRDALEGFVRTAILINRSADALSWIKSLTTNRMPSAAVLTAQSKLLASLGEQTDALATAEQAAQHRPPDVAAIEQLASLHADAGDRPRLLSSVERLRQVAPGAAVTLYYAAVAALLGGDAADAVRLGEQTVAAHPDFAPIHDLLGAALTRLGRAQEARAAFARSLQFDAHDSTAYTNLGLLELAAGNGEQAARHFAEALWLTPNAATAREGFARAQALARRE